MLHELVTYLKSIESQDWIKSVVTISTVPVRHTSSIQSAVARQNAARNAGILFFSTLRSSLCILMLSRACFMFKWSSMISYMVTAHAVTFIFEVL